MTEKIDGLFKQKPSLTDEFLWFLKHVTLGGDPEVMAVVIGKRRYTIPAFLVAHRYEPNVTYKNINIGSAGLDGDTKIFEFRPSASNNPVSLLAKFALLTRNAITYKGIISHFIDVWDSGYSHKPLGGHIHIGSTNQAIASFLKVNAFKIVQTLNNEYNLKPIFISLSTSRRKKSKFVTDLQAVELKDWGFEYRTPPAIIWTEPKLFIPTTTLVVLTTLKAYLQYKAPLVHESLADEIEKSTRKLINIIEEQAGKRNNRKINTNNETRENYIEKFLRSASKVLNENITNLDQMLTEGQRLYTKYITSVLGG